MYDIIVVGGGPAGMTAALYAQRNGKSALVIEKAGFGGQITHSPKVENFPGSLSISGNELADKLFSQILEQGAEFEIETVCAIEDNGATKTVKTEEGGAYECKAVVIATGVKHRMLGIEGEQELVGEGISFCAVCDGDFYKGKTVCVAGGGNSALQEAILLSDKCSRVIMLQDLPNFTGEEKLQQVLFARDNVVKYTGVKITGLITKDSELAGVEIEKDGEKEAVKCDGLFVAIGLIPENEPFKDLADLNSFGYFDSGEECTTKTPG
ncbi:MAG: FAD-dependent oxidoreductase, partial [Eubacterium sp.]|nr:FAD-dependent oxidoreductase [Eubacterium sp.]